MAASIGFSSLGAPQGAPPVPTRSNAIWAGAVATTPARILTSASTAFTAPAFPPQGAPNAEMAYWVGLGGFGTPTDLCQAGIAATRVPNYGIQESLITQDYPHPFKSLVGVHPGDKIVAFAGLRNGTYLATVADATTGTTLSVACDAPKDGGWRHAEWIAESNYMQGQPVLTGKPFVFTLAMAESNVAPAKWLIYYVPGTMTAHLAASGKQNKLTVTFNK